ncbi:MAG: c-type cytochrome [Pseudomonadales bacterium]|nr:c-type cytochrome [Pseudomonadales bacterium]MCP5331235.1 c-type cytochrome [Pseudomonadales bacterium]MCP5344914.1 c-type cytochrome [Pseudomonadales bacterium]
MKHISTSQTLAGLISALLFATSAQAGEPVDADYQAFLNARGEAPWINANADHPRANEAYRPIPSLASFPAEPAKRDLGFALFHDASLSRDGTVGCNTCHMGMMGGTDGLSLARGIDGALGTRNTPTVFNAAFNFRQFWDGRSFDLDAQSVEPIRNPVEMGHDLNQVVASLQANEYYSSLFAEVYADGVTVANLGNALSQHTKDMTRTDSPFNAYLNEESGLSEQALRGQARFNALGCVSCHNGINLGGNSYQPVAANFNTALQYAMAGEEGLYARSGREQDRLVFKVPQLHNISMTAPYYHDGSVTNLPDAIRRMGAQQAGRTLSDEDVDDIATFLASLNSGFFSSMNHNMSSNELQDTMRNQMPDRMGGDMHQQHMQQMQGNEGDMHQQHMRQMQMQNQTHEHAGGAAASEPAAHQHTH